MGTDRSCRSCGAADVEVALTLGELPVANALVDPARLDVPDPRHPLTLAVCARCSLAQILETLPPEELFSDYVYFSSYSDTMLKHAEESTVELCADRRLGAESLVVELASNDGYQLRCFQRAGVPVLGIEPAANVAQAALKLGIPTQVEFFGASVGRRLAAEGRSADVVLAYNVLAHVPDLNGFVAGMRTLLKPDGVVVVEAPHVQRLVEGCEFDTIYHEHLCYFSLSALRPLFARHDLEIFRVAEIALHGGSLRVYAGLRGAHPVEASVAQVVGREVAGGIADGSAYRELSGRVESLRHDLVALIDGEHAAGRRIAAYGAAAKGTTLLNYCGLGADRIEFAADRSPHKQDRLIPGVRIPVVPAERLVEAQPDLCLLLAWNFADEILEQQADYRRGGGRFIVPLPELRIV